MFRSILKINLLKLILFFLIFNFKALALDTKIPVTNEEWDKAYDSLNWKDGPSLVDFNKANSKIDISSNFSILEGAEAHQLLYWLNGTSFDYINIYATDYDGAQYMFYFTDSGYVKTDDWIDVDPNKFIKEIQDNYKVSNETRKKNNQAIVLNVSWKKKPYLDGIYNSVYYALNVQWSDNTSTTEGTAIILGREGYTTGKYVAGNNGYQEQMQYLCIDVMI